MYLKFYGLDREPFHVTPDPEFLFMSPSHKEALATIIYGVEQRKGFIAVTGEVGSGKTTIVRSYLSRLGRGKYNLIHLFNPALGFDELLDSILTEMGLEVRLECASEKVRRLHYALIQEYARGQTVIVIIDEAQNVPVETLENLRMLSNLETNRDKLIQMVLVGQPEFEELLDRRELRQLKQRIALRARLRPLTVPESVAYLYHRIQVAGGTPWKVFKPGALRLLARESSGSPRQLSILADNALIAGFGEQRRPVTRRIVRGVVNDHQGDYRAAFERPECGLCEHLGLYFNLRGIAQSIPALRDYPYSDVDRILSRAPMAAKADVRENVEDVLEHVTLTDRGDRSRRFESEAV